VAPVQEEYDLAALVGSAARSEIYLHQRRRSAAQKIAGQHEAGACL
jgi:hypothetical protein